jgi:hypothetical protein
MKKKVTEPGEYTITFIYKEYKTDMPVTIVAEVDKKAEKEAKKKEEKVVEPTDSKEEVVEEKAK